MLCQPDGGIIDDLILYRLGADRFMVVCNASNRDAVVAHLAGLEQRDVVLEDRSDEVGLVAPQGPAAASVLSGLTDVDLDGLANYHAAERFGRRGAVHGCPHRLHRRGRLRAVLRRRPRARGVGRGRRRGRAGGPAPVRARLARHAAPRGGHAAVRQRARSRHEPVRGRPGPGREAREGGRLRRSRRARGGEGERSGTQAHRPPDGRQRHSADAATRSAPRAGRSGA